MSPIHRGELHDEQVFAFFVLINFQLSAKHFSVLPCYFMKGEDLTFGDGPSNTASAFLKMASADKYFHYEDNFDAAITVTDC